MEQMFLPNEKKLLFLAASKVTKAYDWIEYYDILEVEHLKQNLSYFIDKIENNILLENNASFFPFLKKITTDKQVYSENEIGYKNKSIIFNKERKTCVDNEDINIDFNYRAWYYISPSEQIYWTSIGIYFSQIFEPHMSQPEEKDSDNKVFSYGNRFIKKWSKIDDEWNYDGMNFYSSSIYEPFNRGYSIFKRRIEQKAILLTEKNAKACYIKSDLSGFYPSVTHENFMKSINYLLSSLSLSDLDGLNIRHICEQLKFKVNIESKTDDYQELNGIAEYKYLEEVVLPIGLHSAGLFSNIFFLAIELQLTAFMKNENIDNVFLFRYVDDITILSSSHRSLQKVYSKYSDLCNDYGLEEHPDKKEEGYVDQYNLKPFLTGILNRLSDIGKRVLPALPNREHNNTIDELINFLETDFAEHEIRPDTKDSFIISKIVNTPFSAFESYNQKDKKAMERLQKISKAILLAIDAHPYKYALYKRYVQFLFRYSVSNYQQTFYLQHFIMLLNEKLFKYADNSNNKYVDFIKLSLLHYVTLQLKENYTYTNIKIAKTLKKSLDIFSISSLSKFEHESIDRSKLLLNILIKEVKLEDLYKSLKLEDFHSILFFIPDELKNKEYVDICRNLIIEDDIKKFPFLIKLFMFENIVNDLSFTELSLIYSQLKSVENNHIFDFTRVTADEYISWLKSIEEPKNHIVEYTKSIKSNNFTLMDIIEQEEQWNEYEILLLTTKLLNINGLTNFSPNRININMNNIVPNKENILKVLNVDSLNIFSFNDSAKSIDEYLILPENENYMFSLGVLLYSLASGNSILPARFRGVRKYNISNSLEKYFTKEAFDEEFKKFIINLLDSTIDKFVLVIKLESIISKFRDKKPYSILTQLTSSKSHEQKKYNESVKISIGQLVFKPLEDFNFVVGTAKEPDSSHRIDVILSFIEEAAKESDVLILPELSLPRKYIQPIKRKLHSLANNLMLICGVTYEKFNSKIMLNQGIILDRNNEILFDKLQASPTDETKELNKYGMKLKAVSKINIYEHDKLGKFAILICYDFLSLPIQELLYKEIDTLFILAYNSDVSGFEYTAEAFVRMSLMNVIIVNCGDYGGSLAISPLRDQHKRVRLMVNGNDVNSINTVKIPIESLNQYKKNRKLNTTNFLCEDDCTDDKCKMRFIEYPAHFSEINK